MKKKHHRFKSCTGLKILHRGNISIEWIIVLLGISMLLFSPIYDGLSSTELLKKAINTNYKNAHAGSILP